MQNNQYNRRKSNNSFWALGVGILAGAAIGYYLNSDKGREVRANVKSEFDDYTDQLGGIANEAGKLASNYAREAQYQGRQFVDNTKTRANELVDNARQGINSGKDWVAEKANSVKSTVVG